MIFFWEFGACNISYFWYPTVVKALESDMKTDLSTLTEFARSLVVRARDEAGLPKVVTSALFPVTANSQDLRDALVAQAEAFATFRAKMAAEIDTILATLDRLDVEASVRRGEIAGLSADHNELLVEMKRLRIDADEAGNALVGRLVSEFDRRTTKQP